MAQTAGIPLVDLFDLTDRVASALPAGVQEFVDRFAVVEHAVTRSDAAIFHHGRLRAIDESVAAVPTDFDIGIGRLELPLLQTGIPFQLAFSRRPASASLEPFPDVWRLDLSLEVFTLVTDNLEPAILVPESGTTPRHLLRDPTRSDVRVTGSAVLRFEQVAPGASVNVRFVDAPDPLDPLAASGTVARVVASPPHFFIGGSEFGLSIGALVFDASDSFSPDEVLARNQGPGWQGVLIREATFYAPRNLPGVGDLSGGVRNVLVGSPLGLQGELEIQFGRTALDPAAFVFEQVTASGDQGLAIGGSGERRTVTLEAARGGDVTVHAGFASPAPPSDGSLPAGALQDWRARWRWPDGTEEEGDASSGAARHGRTLRVVPIETVSVDGEDEDFEHPEITFRFVAAGTAPRIDATIGTESFENVVHMSGAAEAIATATLTAVSSNPGGAGTFEWQLERRPEKTSGATFTPPVADMQGGRFVILREKVADDDVRTSRLLLQFRDEGALLVGTEAGVFDAGDATTALALKAVEYTVDLSDFHAEGTFEIGLLQSSLDPADPSRVIVPADGLAQVTIDPGVPAVLERDRHVALLMNFDSDEINRWGEDRPAGTPGSRAFSQADLLAWANRYPGAEFLVVGRCGDIGSADYNRTLAEERALRGERLLTTLEPGQTGAVIDPARVARRGEQSGFAGGGADGPVLENDPDAADESEDIPLAAAEKSTAVGDAALEGGWLIRALEDRSGWPADHVVDHPAESVRETYRRVDIYAIGGAPTPETALDTDEPVVGAALRRSLVPASGRDPAPIAAGSPAIDYRVKLRIVWDSPTVTELKDAIPTLAEAEFAWTPEQAPLPPVDGEAVELSRETLTVFATWTHDARTGYTKATLGIKSEGDPDGLISTTNKQLTAALAFGPVLLSGIDAEDDTIGTGARVAALLGAVGIAGVNLGGDDSVIATGSKSALQSAAFETEMRSISDPGPDMQLRVVTDYVCTLHVDAGVLGLKTAADEPLKIRYKRVGIEYDTSKEGWERFGLVYDTSSLEIENPGRWQIDGVLGEFLRIVEVAVGRGSIWFEGRIAIALEIGIVEITEAIIRLTFRDGSPVPEFELRGLVLRADIPGVLEGEGRLRIEDGGVIRAGIDASIIPLGLGADAGLALGKPPEIAPSVFLELYLGVQFATPLPLAQSGMAIYGFKGLFVMNGQRRLGTNPDPVGRELDWWRAPPGTKYEPAKDRYALGVGVVVGTLPDVSFCVSCAGMVVVAFPDPEVILGVDVDIIEVPDTTVSDEGGASGTITGLIVIDDEAVKLAVSARYTIPKILDVHVPFSGYFPYPSTPGDVYVRIGSDGQTAHGRFGEPVTLTLLPGTLDVRAWTYLMIEQGGLPSLGGDARFSFDGFSVGFGAGWEIDWSAGPIKLGASAKVLVGFGTAPLIIKGGVFVAGELDLVAVSIAARGELILEAREEYIRLDGEFCGEVDLFFFSISGCVGVSIGSPPDLVAPAPPSPVKGVSLSDRRDRIMGTATTGTPAGAAIFPPDDPGGGVDVDGNHTVWPDTAPIIHFAHYVDNAMGAGAQFTPGPAPSQPAWWGSAGLKYAYRLDKVELRRRRDGVLVAGEKPLQSVWTSTPYRQPDGSGTGGPLPSEHEGPNLKLLDWDPWAWVVNLDDGGASQDGDPADTVEDICDPPPTPRPACVHGRDARRAGLNRVRLRQRTPAPGPYPSRFHVTGEPVARVGAGRVTGRGLQMTVERLGGHIVAGGIVPLPFAATLGDETLARGYRLPAARVARKDALRTQTLPWEGLFDRRVASPVVLLVLCEAGAGDGDGDGGSDDPACESFRGVAPRDERLRTFTHAGITFRTFTNDALMTLVDDVDQRVSPAAAGSDGSAEVRIPNQGVDIVLPRPCDRVELHAMQFASPLRGEAFAADGRLLDSDATPNRQREPHVMVFDGDASSGIALLRVRGGSGEAVLFRICCRDRERPEPGDPERVCEDFRALEPSNLQVREAVQGNYAFRSVERDGFLRVTDAVDQRARPAQAGSDGSGDIAFPDSGIRITLKEPCAAVEVHLMRFNAAPVDGVARAADGGRLSSATAGGPQRRAQVMRFGGTEAQPVAEILLRGGAGEAVIYRICCLDGARVEVCTDFRGARLPEGAAAAFSHGGLGFATRSGEPTLRLREIVDAAAEPDRPGRDRVPDLQFPSEGVRITLKEPCDAVELKVMLFANEAVAATALNGLGARVSRAKTESTEQRVMHRLALEGPDIRAIDLVGGAGEAVLYEICCLPGGGERPRPDRPGFGVPDLGVPDTGLPAVDRPFLPDLPADSLLRLAAPSVSGIGRAAATNPQRFLVRGIVDGAVVEEWPGRAIEETGRCRLVGFRPRDAGAGPWNGFRIEPSADVAVTLVGVCGVDQRALDERADDAAHRGEILDAIVDAIADSPEARREIVLEPGEEYEIRVDWSWQAFQAENPGDSPPDPIDEALWQSGASDLLRFKVAPDETVAGTPQDGLNEFVFDARDVSRYLIAVEPADGRGVQFTEDPIWAHFDNGHVEQLLEQYGRELLIDLRRTDPPPTSPATPPDTPLVATPTDILWQVLPLALQPVGQQRLNAAVLEAPCLGEIPPFGGASVAATGPLEPDADYDLRVLAPRTSGMEDDAVVLATRFRTSRYASPRALLDALGYPDTHTAPYLPDDLIVPDGAALPAGTLEEGDVALDAALAALDANTLALPLHAPKSYVFWRVDAGGAWTLEGLLIDSLEPLKRERTVVEAGASVPSVGTRCAPSHALVGASRLDPVRANASWTRVLLVPAAPLSLARGVDLTLSLHLDTSDGPIGGGRRLRGVPGLLEREGFL